MTASWKTGMSERRKNVQCPKCKKEVEPALFCSHCDVRLMSLKYYRLYHVKSCANCGRNIPKRAKVCPMRDCNHPQ